MRSPVAQSALQHLCRLALYKAWGRVGLSAIAPAGTAMILILIGASSGGCSLSRTDSAFARMEDHGVTGSVGLVQAGDDIRVYAADERQGAGRLRAFQFDPAPGHQPEKVLAVQCIPDVSHGENQSSAGGPRQSSVC